MVIRERSTRIFPHPMLADLLSCHGSFRDRSFPVNRRPLLLLDDGFGFRRGAGCALGEFDFLTAEQAEALRQMR